MFLSAFVSRDLSEAHVFTAVKMETKLHAPKLFEIKLVETMSKLNYAMTSCQRASLCPFVVYLDTHVVLALLTLR